MRNKHRLALVEHLDAVGKVESQGLGEKPLGRFVHGLAAKPEGPVVHRDHSLRPQFDESTEGLFGTSVNGAVTIGEIGPDWEKGDVGLQPPSNLTETSEVSSVSGVVYRVTAAFNDVASVAAVHIAKHSRAPVLTGSHCYIESEDLDLLPPFELMNSGEAEIFDEILNAARNDDFGSAANELAGCSNHSSQGGQVEMIHVGVCEEYKVDGREVFYQDSRMPLASQEDKTLRKHWIDEELSTLNLQKKRRVSNECDT
jgi:hypothetical protein